MISPAWGPAPCAPLKDASVEMESEGVTASVALPSAVL